MEGATYLRAPRSDDLRASSQSNADLRAPLRGDNINVVKDFYKNGTLKSTKQFCNGQLFSTDVPAVVNYFNNGFIRDIIYYSNGVIDRDINSPAIIRYYKTGKRREERYIVSGKLSRDNNKPALIEWYPSGRKKAEEYYRDDKIHRDEVYGFARIAWFDTQAHLKKEISYYTDGYLHTSIFCNPSRTIFHENGLVKSKEFRTRGKLNSPGESIPSMEYFTETGKLEKAFFHRDGKLHRLIYPSIIYFNEDGSPFFQEYWENGFMKRTKYVASIGEEPCPVCYETGVPCCILRCNHVVCSHCIIRIFPQRCPLCRHSFDKLTLRI